MMEVDSDSEKPSRPDTLRDFLELADSVSNAEQSVYKSFLLAVERAQMEMFTIQSSCSITIFHKIENEDLDQKKEEGNSSLRSIFFFYAKLQMGGNITFEDLDVSNITISFYELCSMLRDFHVIPALISKEDVQFLWKVMSLQSVKSGTSTITSLDFIQFKEILARSAILAYNRSGMRRLILNSQGQMPSHVDLIETFARHMRLDDYSYVKEKVNTTGKIRVRNQNLRGVGEANDEIKRELREDLKARRLARAQNQTTTKGDVFNAEQIVQAKNIADAFRKKLTGLDASSLQGGDSSLKGAYFQQSGASISDIQERELLSFDPRAAFVFDKYCLNPINHTTARGLDGFQVCDGAFIDLGELLPGRRCVINMFVRNNTSQEIQLDVTSRGFPSRDIHIMTLPNSFAPGMKRSVSVVFTVHKEMFDVVGYIDITIVPVRLEPSVTISCPVYYRIAESKSSRRLCMLPICSVRTLPALLRKYCFRQITPTVTFEKTRNWYKGPGWKNGPEFSFDHAPDDKMVTIPGCYRGLRTISAKSTLWDTFKSGDEKNDSQPILR